MTKCPRCYNHIPADAWSFTERDPQRTEVDERASAFKGHPEKLGRCWTGRRTRQRRRTGSRLKTKSSSNSVVLPSNSARFATMCCPPQLEMGGRSDVSGDGRRAIYGQKTVYIAVMIKRLQRLFGTTGGEDIRLRHRGYAAALPRNLREAPLRAARLGSGDSVGRYGNGKSAARSARVQFGGAVERRSAVPRRTGRRR